MLVGYGVVTIPHAWRCLITACPTGLGLDGLPWLVGEFLHHLQPAGHSQGQPATFRRGSGPGSAVRSIGTRTRFPHSTQEPS